MQPGRRSLDTPARPARTAAPDWRLEALQAELEPLRPGIAVECLAETDSTNTRLLERARAGDTGVRLLVCEHQTAGRGRLGRPWFSDAAATAGGPPQLCFSLGLPFGPSDWSGLSLAVGVALAEALHPSVQLKWPNDLCLADAEGHGRKLGGVLIETLPLPAGRHAVIGIGINLAPPVPRPGLAQATAGWREIEPQAAAPDLLARLAPALLHALAAFESAGFSSFVPRFADRDALAGRPVTTTDPAVPAGRADGVDARGALRLLTDGSLRLLHSGEVSVRAC